MSKPISAYPDSKKKDVIARRLLAANNPKSLARGLGYLSALDSTKRKKNVQE